MNFLTTREKKKIHTAAKSQRFSLPAAIIPTTPTMKSTMPTAMRMLAGMRVMLAVVSWSKW